MKMIQAHYFVMCNDIILALNSVLMVDSNNANWSLEETHATVEGSNTFARFLSELIQGNHKIILSCTTRSRILASKHISNSFECVVSRLSTGQAGSVLDPAQTRPADVGWRAKGHKINYRHKSVKSVLGSSGAGVVRSVVKFTENYKISRETTNF